jgi:protein SCO1/2
MKAIEKAIPSDLLEHVNFSLISLDPDRDSVDVLHNFFNDKKFNVYRWNLYRTDKNETLKLALAVGIKFKKEKNDEYAHSNLIILLDKNGVIKHYHPGLDKNYEKIINIISLLR